MGVCERREVKEKIAKRKVTRCSKDGGVGGAVITLKGGTLVQVI